jgi:nitroimidazol reductase NimA-like FMN-containing flavoprotein (pyridoxamine 5'-phosphate oxidase superfamily)
MDTDEVNPVELISEDDCWELLLSSSLGRLALSVGGEPEIYPVNFVASDRRLVLRTAEGTKILALTVNPRVAFETDGVGRDEAWSVVVKGTARILEKQSEIYAAEQLPLRPLIPTLKYVFVEIAPREVTGRRFPLGPEPERY